MNDNDEDAEPIDRNQPRISVADVAVNTILERLPNLLSRPVETQSAAVQIYQRFRWLHYPPILMKAKEQSLI